MFFAKARCHFCGTKSPHAKGTRQFQCASCEALNFFDERGNIIDTPATVAAANSTHSDTTPLTFTKPLPETLGHQQQQAFCRTCLQNQHLYNQTLANYLPDESHPQYKQFEKAIPQYKKELEKRYPLVCKKCAPNAQSKIERSDYYGLAQNASRLIAETRARGGQPAHRTRDDIGKKMMRMFYNIVGLALFTGLFTQLAFHLYAILTLHLSTAYSEPELTDISDMARPSLNECAQQSIHLHFSNTCYHLFGNLIPYTLALATSGLWYNTGLKNWHHHTYRMEAINGQANYFWMQVMMLVVRAWAWFTLSNPDITAQFTKAQLMAIHGFVIFFVIVTQIVAQRGIQPVRWSMKGRIMPKPSERDVLGANAGPASEHYTPKASEKDPFRYLHNQEPGPLQVINETTKRKQQKQPSYSRSSRPTIQQPSPDYSDDEDAMETDYYPVMRSSQRIANQHNSLQPRHNNNASALSFGGGMSDQVFGMQAQMRAEEERARLQHQQQMQHRPSPFYGKLPPAPMSMERRLRNPVIVPQEPEKVPLSQQPDFMSRMRDGVKPVHFPEKGTNFQPKPSTWNLPSDSREIGLEDRFSTTFSLNDPAPVGQNARRGGLFGGFFGR
ncbi:hypothetical protein PRZ48_012116 [Zasmidium cellare]|uniref:Ima1 N-terminal domain-containing protein n=1 Tax=Zasmidium cellare TaxID=395010 RepID=A0ABR0E3Y8_ZASCE|nr:hypothetical protein PRZ48_012116 [Zasmidium cellare]